jgi:hypothetical protein
MRVVIPLNELQIKGSVSNAVGSQSRKFLTSSCLAGESFPEEMTQVEGFFRQHSGGGGGGASKLPSRGRGLHLAEGMSHGLWGK